MVGAARRASAVARSRSEAQLLMWLKSSEAVGCANCPVNGISARVGIGSRCTRTMPIKFPPSGTTVLLRGFILDPLHLPLSFGARREVEGLKGHHTDSRGRLIDTLARE